MMQIAKYYCSEKFVLVIWVNQPFKDTAVRSQRVKSAANQSEQEHLVSTITLIHRDRRRQGGVLTVRSLLHPSLP